MNKPRPRKTHCKNGHEFTDDNLRVVNRKRKFQECKTCHEAYLLASRHGIWNKEKTHCPQGHEYTPENTWRSPDGSGSRRCKACLRLTVSKYKVRTKERRTEIEILPKKDRPKPRLSVKALERFWTLIDRRGDDECWPWLGDLNSNGYGKFFFHTDGFRMCRGAHCIAYSLMVGEVQEGYELDHLCRNPACCNPSCLEPVTHQENVLRGIGPTAVNARKTHCKNGHPLSGENLRMEGNSRRCLTCSRATSNATAKRLKEKKQPKLLFPW
jgi:hypothetical protein